tara:strand:+ start:820 stop:2514 length:1695 start_codon:yes stop_codon:yes gene_type:complete
MSQNRYTDLSKEEQDWVDSYVDGTIEPEAFCALQDRMVESSMLRAVMRRYLALDNTLQNETSGPEAGDVAGGPWLTVERKEEATSNVVRFPSVALMAVAASFALLLGSAWMYWQSRVPLAPNSSSGAGMVRSDSVEPSAKGFAVIGRLFDVSWPEETPVRREGDMLGAEVFQLASGTAEIQFFSGAMMTIEGPAEISLKSAWEADCLDGSVRMKVPPAARGFRLQAPSTQIVDLGTEFGLEVRNGTGHVEVFDGEIAFRHQEERERLVQEGAAWGLPSDGLATPAATGQVRFPNADAMNSQSEKQRVTDYERWVSHRDDLAKDDRLIAYYTFDRENGELLIPNIAEPRNPEFDGAVVMAEPVSGRWPGMKEALEFPRPGSRVRVNIPGEFPAFTFMCWVRIDSLDRWYNALLMGDGYENGEPHWQIAEDGRLMLSVMVDDTWENPNNPESAGLAHIYYSPPMWDVSMSGQWMHLASVFDPANRRVSHFVDGEQISSDEIEGRFFVDQLHLGNAEIGNWGEPHREDPIFAIRNLNGRMDELAIFEAALDPAKIAELFERSQSRHR